MTAFNSFDGPSSTSYDVKAIKKLSISEEISLYQKEKLVTDRNEEFCKITKIQSLKQQDNEKMMIKDEPVVIYDSLSKSKDPIELSYAEKLLDFSQYDLLDTESKHNPRGKSYIYNRRISQTGNPYKCSDCISSFTSKGNLKFHIKTVHEKVISYPCPKCDAVFSQKGNYKTHYNSVHLQIRPFECLICEAVFSQKGNLKTHLTKMHFTETNITDQSVLMKSPVTKKRGRPPTISLKNLCDI